MNDGLENTTPKELCSTDEMNSETFINDEEFFKSSNGNNSTTTPPHQIFNSDDDSFSSSNSTSSPNLIIDQQDASSKGGYDSDYGGNNQNNNNNILQKKSFKIIDNNEKNGGSSSSSSSSSNPLKRKLIICENGIKSEHNKRIHLDYDYDPPSTMMTITTATTTATTTSSSSTVQLKRNNSSDDIISNYDNSIKKLDNNNEFWKKRMQLINFHQMFKDNDGIDLRQDTIDDDDVAPAIADNNDVNNIQTTTTTTTTSTTLSSSATAITTKNLIISGDQKEGHFQEYAQYLGLKPNVKYKCFKCFNSSYENLSELRDHQKICLFKDNHKIQQNLNDAVQQRSQQQQQQHSSTLSSSSSSSTITTLTQSLLPPSTSSSTSTTIYNSNNNNSNKFLINSKQLIQNTNLITNNNSTTIGIQQSTSSTTINDKQNNNNKIKRKVFLCSACGTYYENWNLFLHMREVHKRHICLYCVGMFPSAERLTVHLEMKHDLEQNHFDCQEKLLRSSRESCYLMCCICEHLFTEHEDFSDHACQELIKPCSLCGEKGRHNSNCKASKTKSSSQIIRLQKKERLKKKTIINNSNSNNKIQLTNKKLINLDEKPLNLSNNFLHHNKTIINDKHNELNDNLNPSSLSSSQILHSKLNGCNTTLENNDNNKLFNDNNFIRKSITDEYNLKLPTSLLSLNNDDRNYQKTSKILDNRLGNYITNNSNENLSQTANETSSSIRNIFNTSDNNNILDFSMQTPTATATNHNISDNYYSNNNDFHHPHQHHQSPLPLPPPSSPYLNDNPTILDNNNPPTTTIEQPEEKPPILLVPKFKIKIPKEYQTPIDSEQTSSSSSSATESGSDEDELDKSLPIESDSDNAAGGAGAVASGGGVDDEIDVSKETIEEETKIIIPINNDIETTNMANDDDDDENINKSDVTENCDENEKDKTTTTATIEKKQESSSDGDGDAAAGDGIEIANDDVQLIELSLNMPLDKISMIDFLRICLRRTYPICLYCNHARRIAVNGHSLALHFIGQHRFSATVDSITAEELQPSTILMKIKSFLPNLNQHYFNLATYNNNYALDQQHEQQEEQQYLNRNEKIFECFQCRFETSIHKELYLHNRKMHLKTAILCFMCRSNFFNYSEILCHICPGMANKCALFDIEFRCCLCSIDKIPSAFRLMVHLRKKHYACDVCLEDCHDQSRLSSHVWKHKLHHLCYRCGIAYRNKPDITKHLFWKHGTESILCKRCLQKRWPHVYHFCIPPPTFLCEICNLTFSKAMSLKVHKRLHTGDAPYHCIEDNCDKKFISRKLLLKHVSRHTTEDIEMKNTIIKEEDDEKKINLKENVDIIKKLKEENLNVDNEKQEKIDENIEVIPKEIGPTKKKRKKSKKDTKENLDDIMNMPAPNLSESDSSDDSAENEKTKLEIFSPTTLPNIMLSPASDNGNDKDDDEEILNTGKIMDIWENFKTFQATQPKVIDDDLDDIDILSLPPPILHVIQSDHDYCMMYKPLTTKLTKISSSDDTKIDDDNILLENKDEIKKPEEVQKSPKKKQKTSKKTDGKTGGSDSSSSGSSSSSDSTCSCGSNCSCSSSSGGSSSDSSSSSDTDSSTSEGKRRIAAKRAAKRAEKRNNKNKLNDTNSPKTNLSDIVDVVTTDTKPQDFNPDTIILESDLETDESETDEDFYDEHPQKLANQLLAEKRKQLMIQTSLSPSHNYDIVENSRPSTPSLPEEMIKEKKVKIKKKKRDRKTPKHNSFKLNIPNLLNSTNQTLTALAQLTEPMIFSQPEIPIIQQVQQQAPIILSNEEIPMKISTPPIKTIINMSAIPPQQQIIPAPITNKNRLSTGSSSDADASLKRSKRRRRPNKFYGYSSDDDMTGTTQLTGPAAFKPTPPPNLTWRKEDLPTPPRNSSSQKTNRSSLASTSSSSLSSGRTKLSQLSTPPLLPPIPPIIIRPNLIGKKVQTPQQQQQQHDRIFQKPPIMDVMRVPPVPPHHIQPTSQQYIFNRESMESESSDDDRLHISTVPSRILQSPIMQQPIQQTPPSLPFSSTPIVPILPVHQPTPPHPVKQQRIPPALLPNPDLARLQYFQRNHIRYPIRPPAGARPPREGESVYCYCRCPYDEVSEMIACDGDDCVIEWFHFECVGIMVPPKGKWFCPECRPNYPNEQYDNT